MKAGGHAPQHRAVDRRGALEGCSARGIDELAADKSPVADGEAGGLGPPVEWDGHIGPPKLCRTITAEPSNRRGQELRVSMGNAPVWVESTIPPPVRIADSCPGFSRDSLLLRVDRRGK